MTIAMHPLFIIFIVCKLRDNVSLWLKNVSDPSEENAGIFLAWFSMIFCQKCVQIGFKTAQNGVSTRHKWYQTGLM